MTSNSHCRELLELLSSHEILILRGYNFAIGSCGRLVVERRGHVRGLWGFDGVQFTWTPAGTTEPTYWAPSIEAAVRYTLVVLST